MAGKDKIIKYELRPCQYGFMWRQFRFHLWEVMSIWKDHFQTARSEKMLRDIGLMSMPGEDTDAPVEAIACFTIRVQRQRPEES